MPTYKGNVGNLMQHWTLCELLDITNRHYEIPGLNFIDAHAMAPRATENKGKHPKFAGAEARLGNSRETAYERAWHQIAPRGGYPSSANFVQQVWTRKLSLLLCEKDLRTIEALRDWLPRIQAQPNCQIAKMCRGDWRTRFDKKLPAPPDVGLPDGSLTLVSFDPYKYDWHRDRYERRNQTCERQGTLYPQDIERTICALQGNSGQVLIQISTYSPNGANPQGAVISSVNSIFSASGFTLCAVVRVDGNMMSLVYAHNVPWSAELANLPCRFSDWARAIPT